MVRGVTLDLSQKFPDHWQWPSSTKGIDLASRGVELAYRIDLAEVSTGACPVAQVVMGPGMAKMKGWLN